MQYGNLSQTVCKSTLIASYPGSSPREGPGYEAIKVETSLGTRLHFNTVKNDQSCSFYRVYVCDCKRAAQFHHIALHVYPVAVIYGPSSRLAILTDEHAFESGSDNMQPNVMHDL